MKLYALPGCRTYHELTPAYEGSLSTRAPHLKCDPRKTYNDLMTTADSELFRAPHPRVEGIGRVFLCGRCFRAP